MLKVKPDAATTNTISMTEQWELTSKVTKIQGHCWPAAEQLTT